MIMWRCVRRYLHPNFRCSTDVDSSLIVDTARATYLVYQYLDKIMTTRHNDYLVDVARIFPFVLNTKMFTSVLGEISDLKNKSRYEVNRNAIISIDKILESEVFTIKHFDLAYRLANPLFCLEEIDRLNNYDVVSCFKRIDNIGNSFVFKLSILETLSEDNSNKISCDTTITEKDAAYKKLVLTSHSVHSSNDAAFTLLRNDIAQEIAYNLESITNEYIVDVVESKFFNNYPDFGDHNVGKIRQVNISLNKIPKTSSEPAQLGIKLVGGDIVNKECISYISKFYFGPIFIDSIKENTIAASHNNLFVGDCIIAINQTNVQGQSLPIVNNLIKDAMNSNLDSIQLLVKHDPLEYKANQYLMEFNTEKFNTFNKAVMNDSGYKKRKSRLLRRMTYDELLDRL